MNSAQGPIPGLSPEEGKIVKAILAKRLEPWTDARVWIFGSRATGRHRPFSDVDLLLSLPPGAPVREIARALAEDFEESRLVPKVDLVLAEDLADSYRPGVERDRQLIWVTRQ